MAPSEKAITTALRAAVQSIFNSTERENLSVNLVRRTVEKELGLDGDFLKGSKWKGKSKTIILEENDRLLDAEDKTAPVKSSPPQSKSKNVAVKNEKQEPVKKAGKRASNGEQSKPRKRQKKDESPVSDGLGSEFAFTKDESAYENDVIDAPKPTKEERNNASMVVSKRERKPKVESKVGVKPDEDEEEESRVKPKPESSSRNTKAEPKIEAKDDSILQGSKPRPKHEDSKGGVIPKEDSNVQETKPLVKAQASPESKKPVKAASDSELSDLSDVYDETPKPKSKPKAKSNPSTKPTSSTKSSSKPKPGAAAAPNLSPAETEIKLLQSQLLKCGIRKIWAFELKSYGDDSTGKIRHLRAMLREAGMDGRFSEAKAKEIKEARELEADLEAVREGAKLWGKGGEQRVKERKSLKESGSEGEEDEEEEAEARGKRGRGSAGDEKVASSGVSGRIARAKMDLAFLGDEESDSD